MVFVKWEGNLREETKKTKKTKTKSEPKNTKNKNKYSKKKLLDEPIWFNI